MAQIVTITNPLTGQPAQVDQLEHTAQQIDDAIARALPGGAIDITLANKMGGVESADHPGCYYRMVGSVVEWFNPPMLLGVEYRTTERYLGKPVYAMIINCGMSEDNKIIRVTPENGLDTLIRGDVVLGGEPAFYIAGNDFLNSYSRYANVEQDGGQIKIDLHQGSSVGSKQTYAIVYYTKE